MVAVIQAKEKGMNNIYGCINLVFTAQKYINNSTKKKTGYVI